MITPWEEIYKGRVDNHIYTYKFIQRYRAFLEFIMIYINKKQPRFIIEEGCGIGMISKCLVTEYKFNVSKAGFQCFEMNDYSEKMLQLCKINLDGLIPIGCLKFSKSDILNQKNYVSEVLQISHGVLEHFSDEQIKYYLKNRARNSINYVPLGGPNGYDKPSRGDERLLPLEYWVDTFNLKKYFTFNNGKDLAFLVNNKT